MSRLGSLTQSVARHRWLTATTVLAYLAVYLLAIQNLVVARSLRTDLPSFELLPGWVTRLTEPIAPFYFEPVAALYLTDHLTLLISPLNLLLIGLVLGGLVALNLAVAVDAYRHARACRRRAVGGLLGSLPGFLTGFACCVPTVALVLGGPVHSGCDRTAELVLPGGGDRHGGVAGVEPAHPACRHTSSRDRRGA